MSYLFIIENKKVTPNPETLLIEPFSKIWERDKSEYKQYAIEDLSFIEFVTSFKESNPYRQYPEDTKHSVVKKEIITRKDWVKDELILEGIEKVKIFQTEGSTVYLNYLAVKKAREKVIKFLDTFDINKVNPKTLNPLYKLKDINDAMSGLNKITEDIKKWEKLLKDDFKNTNRVKAGKKITIFADPNSIKTNEQG